MLLEKTKADTGLRLTRRSFAAGALSLLAVPQVLAAPNARRIICLDYGLAQTLIELGAVPLGLVNANDWDRWCGEPALPDSVVNIGATTDVNMSLLVQLKPDLIVSTPFLEAYRSQLERIAPVESFPIHNVGGSPYPHILAATRKLAELTGLVSEGEALIARTESQIAAAYDKVAPLRGKPLVFVSFLDTRHVRVYGPGGNYQDVLDLLELTNGWNGASNSWGFATVGYEQLPPDPDVTLFCMENVPPDVFPTLEGSPLWNSLPFVKAGAVYRLPHCFMFGTLPSMSRFARILSEAAVHHA